MSKRKPPSKVSRAAKTLSTSASPRAKKAAAKTLAHRSTVIRKVHAAPKAGTISRAAAKSAVRRAKAK